MRRLAVLLGFGLAIVGFASTAQAQELAPLVTGNSADQLGPGYTTWTVQQAFRGQTTPREVVQIGDYTQMPSGLAPGTVVMYDLEKWNPTPIEQYTDPRRSERAFVALAHSMGYRAMLAPSGSVINSSVGNCRRKTAESTLDAYIRCLASVPSDFFLVQAQGVECNTSGFVYKVQRVDAIQTGLVIAEVSVIKPWDCVTAQQLEADVTAVLKTSGTPTLPADGFSVWGLAGQASALSVNRPADQQLAMMQQVLTDLGYASVG
jgi:hypothetical protein